MDLDLAEIQHPQMKKVLSSSPNRSPNPKK